MLVSQFTEILSYTEATLFSENNVNRFSKTWTL